jgi:hypothetical protein
MQVHQGPAPWLSYAIPLVVFAVVMALRWRRMRRARRLRLEMLWILPAIYAAVVAAVFVITPPSMAGWAWSALALAVGAGIGWYRGRMMKITIDPTTHALSQQASPAAFLLLAALVAVKFAARTELGGPPGMAGHGPSHGAMLATDIAMAFALGLISTTRIEMALRARRLLAAARRAPA